MPKWIKISLRILIALFFVVIAGVNIIGVMMRSSDVDIVSKFSEKGFDVNVKYYPFKDFDIRSVEVMDSVKEKPLIIFVHGAPGNWDAFESYLTDRLLWDYTDMIAIDRPGYGPKDRGRSMTSIKEQSEALYQIVSAYNDRKIILVGHSYGGPIIAQCAVDHPNEIDNVIMIAPVIDPYNEKIWWFSYFGYWKLTRWMLPGTIKVAGAEKFDHADELLKIKGIWKNFPLPITHIHCEDDWIAPGKANIDFGKNNINPDKLKMITYPDKGHLVLWTDIDLIRNELINTLKELD